MLELLTRWTPLAQFLGPLIAAVAAAFAARSARASSTAARDSRRVNDVTIGEIARTRRPELRLSVDEHVGGGQVSYRVVVENVHEENEARDLTVELKFASEDKYRQILQPCSLGPSRSKRSGIVICTLTTSRETLGQQGDNIIFVETIGHGRVQYSDVHRVEQVRQSFNVDEQARLDEEGEVARNFQVNAVSVPEIYEETESPRVRDRIVGAWRVLLGRDGRR